MAPESFRVAALIPAYNEGYRVVDKVISRVPPDQVQRVVLIDDGSADDTAAVAQAAGATVLRHERNRGVGAAIRTGLGHARTEGFDAVVILNAAGKYDPADLGELLQPLREGTADLCQGSRYLDEGRYAQMPLYRRVATRFYSRSFTALLGHRVTDGTCGIRALRLRSLDDPRVNLDQAWLDGYELEPYLLWTCIDIGLRVVEVPITLHYPKTDYTRMRPWVDWWHIYRPLIRLRLGRGR